MSIKKNGQWLYLALLIGLILWVNPLLFSARPLFDSNDIANHQLYPVQFTQEKLHKSDLNGKVLSSFRADEIHSGEYPARILSKIKPKKLWSIGQVNLGIHGASKSSPAVDDTGIYVGSDGGVFYHYDWKGSLVWKWWIPEHHRGIHSTALLTEQHVFFATYNGKMYCLDKKNGKPLWVTRLGDAIGASPILIDGSLFVTVELTKKVGGYLVKINAQSGKVIWRTIDFEEQSHSSPTIDKEKKIIYLGANNSKFYAISAESGEILWTLPTAGPVKSTSTLVDNMICYTDWGKKLKCLDKETRIPLIDHDLKGASQVSPAFSKLNDFLLAADGHGYFYSFKPSTKELLWSTKVSEDRVLGSPSLLSINNQLHIIGACESHSWCLWRAQPFRKIYTAKGNSKITSSPVLHKNLVIVSYDNPGELEVWSLNGEDIK